MAVNGRESSNPSTMAKPSESITLYGERAERFREIRKDIENRLGYKPTNAETLGIIMSEWDLSQELKILDA